MQTLSFKKNHYKKRAKRFLELFGVRNAKRCVLLFETDNKRTTATMLMTAVNNSAKSPQGAQISPGQHPDSAPRAQSTGKELVGGAAPAANLASYVANNATPGYDGPMWTGDEVDVWHDKDAFLKRAACPAMLIKFVGAVQILIGFILFGISVGEFTNLHPATALPTDPRVPHSLRFSTHALASFA